MSAQSVLVFYVNGVKVSYIDGSYRNNGNYLGLHRTYQKSDETSGIERFWFASDQVTAIFLNTVRKSAFIRFTATAMYKPS